METTNKLKQQLDLLLSAHGYNLYSATNRARADDLLVRERACSSLGDAAKKMSLLAAAYSAAHIPPSTREQPFPPAANLAEMKKLKALHAEISQLGTRIRGMAAPTQDKAWARFREEADILTSLLGFDYQLVTEADALYWLLEPLTEAQWTPELEAEVRTRLRAVEQIARERERLLVQPF